MKLIETLKAIKTLQQPIFQTSDLATYLKLSTSTSSKILNRLATQGHIVSLRRGIWAIPELVDPLMLPEYLTAPMPSYISLQTALYYHGMISQIPTVIYAVSLARSEKITTPMGEISIHHVSPNFFFGYESIGKHQIKIASPEKALLDFCYLSSAKHKLFSLLPELELPKKFNIKKANSLIKKIKSKNRQTQVKNCFENQVIKGVSEG